MKTRRGARVARAAVAVALVLPHLACGEALEARRRRAEGRVLKRQIQNLKGMIQATSERRLVAQSWLAIAVDETAVKSVIEAGLPQEAVIAKRFRVRVETAKVSFRSGEGLVSLTAQVTDEQSPDRRARVVYQGGFEDITVSDAGRLQTSVLIDNVELPEAQAAGADAGLLGSVAEQLAGRNLEMLQGLIPAIAIPVRLQQNLALEGFGDGPVQVDPGELPIGAKIARVLPLSGRLWVFLDVTAGPWRRTGPNAVPPEALASPNAQAPGEPRR